MDELNTQEPLQGGLMAYEWVHFHSDAYRALLDSLDCEHITDRLFLGDQTQEEVDALIDALDDVNPFDYTLELRCQLAPIAGDE